MCELAFAEQLVAARTALGWTRRRLSIECGWDHSYISRLESQQRQPSAESVLVLCGALGLDAGAEARMRVAAGYWPGTAGALLVLSGAGEERG